MIQHNPNSVHPRDSTVKDCRHLCKTVNIRSVVMNETDTCLEMDGTPEQLPPLRVLCMTPAAVPCSTFPVSSRGNDHSQYIQTLTQSIVEMSSQMIELAMLASTCTAPSMIHNTYAAANIVVHTALKRKKINLSHSVNALVAFDHLFDVQGMIAGRWPSMTRVPGIDEKRGEAKLSDGDESHEEKEPRVVTRFGSSHDSKCQASMAI